LRRIVNATCRL